MKSDWMWLATALLVGLQVACILALVIRTAWQDWRLRRERGRTKVLAGLFEDLFAERSAHLKRALVRKEVLQDASRLEAWLDLVAERGEDPAQLPPTAYQELGLVARYSKRLRTERRWTDRAAAAAFLGWTHSPDAITPLLECLQDRETEAAPVRAVALRALARIRHVGCVPELIEGLRSPEPWFPPLVATALARIGPEAVPALGELVVDDEDLLPARRHAAQVLGSIGSPLALRGLHQILSDPDAELRSRAADALGLIGEERSVDRLLPRLLSDPIPQVRSSVARALSRIAAVRTVETLVEALGDPEWWVRLRAVEGLALLGDAAEDILLGALHDQDSGVAREAARALEANGVVARMLGRLRKEGYSPEVGEFLVELGQAGNLEPLLDELEAPDEQTVGQIVRILARVGDHRAGPNLAALLQEGRFPRLSARLLDGLLRVADPAHASTVLPFLRSENEWARNRAVEYLRQYLGTGELANIEELFEDESPFVRRGALQLLQGRPPDESGHEAVRRCLDDPQIIVQAEALRSLGHWGQLAIAIERGPLRDPLPVVLREAWLDALGFAGAVEFALVCAKLLPTLRPAELPRLREMAESHGRNSPPYLLDEAHRALPSECLAQRWLRALWAGSDLENTAELLERSLRDPDARVRSAALISRLRQLPDPAQRQSLLAEALEDADSTVLFVALDALAREPDPALEPALRRQLRRKDEVALLAETALALAMHEEPRSLDALRKSSLSRSLPLRVASLLALARRGDEMGLVSWLEALRETEVVEQLRKWELGQHPLVQLVRMPIRDADQASQLRGLVISANSAFEAEQALMSVLDRDSDASARRRAVEWLVLLGSGRASGRLFASYRRDPDAGVRLIAMEALVRSNAYGRRRQFLEMALRDPEMRVRTVGAHLSVLLEPVEASELLLPHLGARPSGYRDAVIDVLAGLLERDADEVLDLLLGSADDKATVRGLVDVLSRSTIELADVILRLLLSHRWAEIRARALPHLLPRLEEGQREGIESAMGDPSPQVREQLVKVLAHPRAVEWLGSEKAVRQNLRRLEKDPSPKVQNRAIQVLESLETVEVEA